MTSFTKSEPKSLREISYYRQRFRNRVFTKLIDFISEQAEKRGLTRRDIAEKLGKDPAQITRLLRQPGNMTLDTISDLLLALDAEAEPPEIVLFEHRSPSNYVHPLIAKIGGHVTKARAPLAKSHSASEGKIQLPPPGRSFEAGAA